jgi:DNA-binding Lrp family transcriptional regulator
MDCLLQLNNFLHIERKNEKNALNQQERFRIFKYISDTKLNKGRKMTAGKISEIDAKILKTLLVESRTSFTEIANHCGISVSAVRKRYNLLKDAGIINGEIMQVNPYAFDYKCVCDIGITASIKNEKEIIQKLNTTYSIGAVIGPWGKFNIKLLVALRRIDQLPRILHDIEADYRTKTVDTLIWTEPVHMDHPENLSIGPLTAHATQEEHFSLIEKAHENTPIDEKDLSIARILSVNSRTPFSEIGEKLDLSTASVIQRYKKLRKNLLTLSTITVDLNKLGYNAMMHTLIKVANKSKIGEVHAKLLEIPNLIVAIKYLGTYDFLTLSAIRDFNEFFSIKDKIRAINEVEKEETFLWQAFPKWPANVFAPILNSQHITHNRG